MERKVTPTLSLVHSILSVSHATTEENALDANIAGFLYVAIAISTLLPVRPVMMVIP